MNGKSQKFREWPSGKPAVPKGKADKVGLFKFFKLGTETLKRIQTLETWTDFQLGQRGEKPWPMFFQKLQRCYVGVCQFLTFELYSHHKMDSKTSIFVEINSLKASWFELQCLNQNWHT